MPRAEKLRTLVTSRMRRAYHADSALAAEAELGVLAAELDRSHPGAAASLREGMAETLTVPAAEHATHAGPDVPVHERDREHDQHLS
jgi:hypothetical protein